MLKFSGNEYMLAVNLYMSSRVVTFIQIRDYKNT